jgi:hypothetical protein
LISYCPLEKFRVWKRIEVVSLFEIIEKWQVVQEENKFTCNQLKGQTSCRNNFALGKPLAFEISIEK